MTLLRILLAAFRIFIFITTSIIIFILFKLVRLLFSKFTKLRSALNRVIFKYWSTILIKSLGGKIEVKGWEVKNKTVFVSNHISYLDIIILNTAHPFAFVAKSEIAGWPLLGSLAKGVDTIFIDRSNPLAVKNLYKDIDHKISHGDSVLIFPEGTTSSGEDVLEFKKGIFMPILRAKSHNNSLGCLSIKYHLDKKYGDQKDKIAWWGDAEFLSHFLSLVMIPNWKVVISAKEYKIGERRSSAIVSKETYGAVKEEFENI